MNQLPLQPRLPPQPFLQGGGEHLDIGRLLNSLRVHKWGILSFALAVTLFTGLVVFSMQPIYEARGSIELQSQEANVVSVEEVYSLSAGHFSYTSTQYEIMKSRGLAERVVRKLRLYQHPYFLPNEEDKTEPWYKSYLPTWLPDWSWLPGGEKEPQVELTDQEKEEALIQLITGSVAAGLTVTPVQFSYIVYLSYRSPHRELAAQIVNALAEEFISSNLESRTQGTLQATDWLDVRLVELAEKLRLSEQALQDYRDREGLVSMEGVTALGGNELAGLAQRLNEASKARIEAKNIMDDLQGLANPTTEQLLNTPAIMGHQSVKDLKRAQSAAERKIIELSNRYGPRHPQMIAAQTDRATAKQQLRKEVSEVVSGISREYQLAVSSERQLKAEWEARKSEVQEFNRKEFELQELQRDVDTNLQLYDIFFTRIKSVGETGAFERPHARIVDKALVPGSPVEPKKGLSITIALILGSILGCAIAIVLDILDNTIKSPDDVQSKLGVPLLGSIPKVKTDKNGDFEQFWQQRQGQYAEALRTIRTGVVLSGLDDPAKVIVVTSTLPGEGKSTLSLNLGSALGQMENVLVIGADLRRPSLAQRCNLTPNHQGLSHLVSGTAEMKDCLRYLEEQNMYVMPAGVIPTNPLEMISSSKFLEALEDLKGKFDRIVIDSAPLQIVSDAMVLGSYADSVIYVVKADSTSAFQAKKGIASMLASNQPLTGVVLNQFDAKKASQYYYGGKYHNYTDYYPSHEPAKA